jgi:hypothetical protein
VQRATAQSKTGIFRDFGEAEAPPGFQACNEVMFFISVIPPEIRRFKFTVSWLCDDHIAADNLRRKRPLTSRYDSPHSALSKEYTF